jgi:hypothetical protein
MNFPCLDAPLRADMPFTDNWVEIFEYTLRRPSSSQPGEVAAIGVSFDLAGNVPNYGSHPTRLLKATRDGFEQTCLEDEPEPKGHMSPYSTLTMQVFANPAKVKVCVLTAIQPEAGFHGEGSECTAWYFGKWMLATSPDWRNAGLVIDPRLTGHEYMAALGGAARVLECMTAHQ